MSGVRWRDVPKKFRLKTACGAEHYLSLTELIKLSNLSARSSEEIIEIDQLVGYDKNGDEVYEGDVLEYDYEPYGWHYEYAAHIKGFATTADGCYVPCEKFSERRLKK